jgi:threonylcarbamoyladenosine tRNA methylthiotransferase MtaB
MTSFYIEQFGCRATQADGAALERQLRERGCVPAIDAGCADVVIVNTCTVTSAADAQARDAIRKIHARNPNARIIATGCYAQRAPEDLAALAGVTYVVGNSHKPQIPILIWPQTAPSPQVAQALLPVLTSAASKPRAHQQESTAAVAPFVFKGAGLDSTSGATSNLPLSVAQTLLSVPQSTASNPSPSHAKILTGNILEQTALLAAPVFGGEGNHTRPVLKIQDGCNLRCSYCVIPFVRGKSRSLPPHQILDEIGQLTATGQQEIVLSGINLGMYGRDLTPRVEFEDLLRRILDETSIARLRISSIEPMDVTRDLVALFASTDRLARHFHMPLQSASDAVLAAMHRWYRAEHYERRIELVREQLPEAAIGADVITGFPGETEADHEATLAFIDRLPFTYLHVFSFSKRPGTRAASRNDEILTATIHRRARELRALSHKKSAAFYELQSGKPQEVLTLRHTNSNARAASSENWTPAISSNYLQIRISGHLPPNQLLRVVLSAAIASSNSGAHYLNAQPETTPAIPA